MVIQYTNNLAKAINGISNEELTWSISKFKHSLKKKYKLKINGDFVCINNDCRECN